MTKPGARSRRSLKKIALWTIVGLIALFVLIQFVPYGRDHTICLLYTSPSPRD